MNAVMQSVSAGGSYEATPHIVADGDDVVVIYNDGDAHLVTTTRKVAARTGASSWAVEETVYDAASVDDACWGVGNDSTGRPLAWINQRAGDDSDSGALLRRREAGVWSTVTSSLGFTGVRLLNSIINVAGVGLVATWQSRSDTTLAWGPVISPDDGATWSQVTVETGMTASTRPVEMFLLDVGSSTILGIGRDETSTQLFQLKCVGDPSTAANWSRSLTNVTDIGRDRGWLALRPGDATTVDLYYTDRTAGALRWRSATLATVLADPTAWGSATTLWTGGNTALGGQDFGYVHGIQRNSRNLLCFYSGNEPESRVMVLEHDPAA